MVTKDKLNEITNTIQQLRNVYRALAGADDVIDVLRGYTQNKVDLEREVRHLKMEAEKAKESLADLSKLVGEKRTELEDLRTSEFQKINREIVAKRERASEEVGRFLAIVRQKKEMSEEAEKAHEALLAKHREELREAEEKLDGVKKELDRLAKKFAG
jgi:chromosome segregation ATPase